MRTVRRSALHSRPDTTLDFSVIRAADHGFRIIIVPDLYTSHLIAFS